MVISLFLILVLAVAVSWGHTLAGFIIGLVLFVVVLAADVRRLDREERR